MKHSNLLLFKDESALNTKYPNGKIDSPNPGVAYARGENQKVIYNDKKTNYALTIECVYCGFTVVETIVMQSPDVLEGDTVTFKVNAPDLSSRGYLPGEPEHTFSINQDTTYRWYYYSPQD